MTAERQTKQKTVILGYLRSVKIHPTAETVYSAVKKEISNISLGTVYRNLEEFSRNEIIKKIEAAGKKRFDGDISAHGHFICSECGRIDDLFFKKKPKINFSKKYSIDNTDLIIKGRCEKCINKK